MIIPPIKFVAGLKLPEDVVWPVTINRSKACPISTSRIQYNRYGMGDVASSGGGRADKIRRASRKILRGSTLLPKDPINTIRTATAAVDFSSGADSSISHDILTETQGNPASGGANERIRSG